MSTQIGSIDIYTQLANDLTVTGLLDTIEGNPAIFNDLTIPQAMIGNKTINIYQVSTMDGGLCYSDLNYTVNCRGGVKADTNNGYTDSIAIQLAVFQSLNRLVQNGYSFLCTLLPPIPPIDKNDNYNSPVEVRVRKR